MITDTVRDRNWWFSSPGGAQAGGADRWWGHRPWGGDRYALGVGQVGDHPGPMGGGTKPSGGAGTQVERT